jgi:hypothetical protein
MTTKTEAIRALNDELRQSLTTGTALMTAGVAALGAEAVARIFKTIAVSATLMTHTKSMTLDRSKLTATSSFSRSIITISRARITHQIPPIHRSPSAWSRSCWRRNTD